MCCTIPRRFPPPPLRKQQASSEEGTRGRREIYNLLYRTGHSCAAPGPRPRQQETSVTNLCGCWRIRRSRPRCGCPARLFGGAGLVFLGGFKRHARPQTKVGRTSETFWTTEFARAREIKPRLDDWKRELALFTLVQRERYYPTTYLDGNETAQPGCWTRSTAGYWSQGLVLAG